MQSALEANATSFANTSPAIPAQVVVVIPALNEEASLPRVIAHLHKLGLNRIRVVDNGSHDRTAEVAKQSGTEVIDEPRRGYGQACWTGCENLPPETEWILFCNADGSDDIERVPELMQATDEEVELVLGTRTTGDDGHDHLTPSQRFGNKLATTLLCLLWGARYADLGPLRLISRRAFERLNMQDRGFGWTVEMQVRAAEEGLKICQVPVRNFPRSAGVSKISGTVKGSIQAGTIILSTLVALWLKRPGVQRALVWLSALLLMTGAAAMLPFGDFDVVGIAVVQQLITGNAVHVDR
jgi:glycosyltransferase involved in cell wall biosynthesis